MLPPRTHRMRISALFCVASSLALFAPPSPAAIARAPLRLAAPARPTPLLTRASHARMAAAAAPEGASFPESKNWAPWARSINLQEKFEAFSGAFSTLFPVWTLAVALVGLYRPAVMASIPTSAFTGLLGLLMLSMGIVHGDLSAYNILYWDGKITFIDFPQVSSVTSNPNAEFILKRDITRVCDYFSKQGVDCDADHITRHLWSTYGFERDTTNYDE